jgi:hypothetical protein
MLVGTAMLVATGVRCRSNRGRARFSTSADTSPLR